jgi:CheY-like chemotaxis protein
MGPDPTKSDKGRTAGANGSAVLVVDGGPAMRKLLRDILTRSELECIEAADGESGLRLAATHPVSTAVVSLQLSGMDGLELAWRLHSERPALCIVGLSDYAELWDADGLRGLGIRRVLSAPFGPGELLRAIRLPPLGQATDASALSSPSGSPVHGRHGSGVPEQVGQGVRSAGLIQTRPPSVVRT